MIEYIVHAAMEQGVAKSDLCTFAETFSNFCKNFVFRNCLLHKERNLFLCYFKRCRREGQYSIFFEDSEKKLKAHIAIEQNIQSFLRGD